MTENTIKVNMKTGQSNQLPVHIVEQHNDVVPFIHRAIASKRLPFSGVPIIHLDSHPDLLIPIHLDADSVFKPKDLYEALSIENWLLPLTYAKHIDHVIWVKPPWANQIRAFQQSFFIGKCSRTGKLRLSSKENYFLTDGLFCSPKDLLNCAQCKLSVVELCPQNWNELDPCFIKSNQKDNNKSNFGSPKLAKKTVASNEEALNSDGTNGPDRKAAYTNGPDKKAADTNDPDRKATDTNDPDRKTADKLDYLFNDYEMWTSYLQETTVSKPFILDIDLDFFSTKNPFRETFESEKTIVQQLFKCPPLTISSDQEIETFTQTRKNQLQQLEDFFTALDMKWSVEDVTAIPLAKLSGMSLEDLTGLDSKQLSHFHPEQQKDLKSLCQSLFPSMREREITFIQIYDYGCTLDDTDLPHHISNDIQIEALMSSLRSVLVHLSKPAIVTISRSSHDDYCPMDQVDKIESMVLKLLCDVFGSLDISKNYDE